jgi:benzoylformate decarboxylase
VALAEHLEAPVHVSPSPHRLPFPNRHRLFAGVLPAGIRSVGEALAGHDLVVVLGAPVFRYHQHEPGELLPAGTALVQVTDDGSAAARAAFGEALLARPDAAVTGLLGRLGVDVAAVLAAGAEHRFRPCPEPATSEHGLHPAEVFATLRESQPPETAYVVESTSTNADFWSQMDLRHPGSYFFPASGGLGFGLPATVGVALARPDRRVVGVVGDGSASYGITALWTAAQLGLPVTFVVLRNGSYGALRWFADLLATPDVPGLDVPDIDFVSIASGYGVPGTHVTDLSKLRSLLAETPTGPRLLQLDTTLTTPA